MKANIFRRRPKDNTSLIVNEVISDDTTTADLDNHGFHHHDPDDPAISQGDLNAALEDCNVTDNETEVPVEEKDLLLDDNKTVHLATETVQMGESHISSTNNDMESEITGKQHSVSINNSVHLLDADSDTVSIVEDIAVHNDFENSTNIAKNSHHESPSNDISYSLEKKNHQDFIIVTIPDQSEMIINKNATADFYLDDRIVNNIDILSSTYRFFLMFSGLISSRFTPAHSVRYFLQKVFIFVFILCFLLLKFGALFDLDLIVIEKKFPFTVINNIVWELRWILTYMHTLYFMSQNGLQNFLKDTRISRRKWRQNGRTMQWYVIIIFIITVITPCVFVGLDLNFLNLNTINQQQNGSIFFNVMFTIIVFVYRMIVVPCFCLVSVMLYLLGDHVRQVGKEMYSQTSCKDAHNLVRSMRKLIRSTEKSLQIIIMVHMFLIFCTSFTTVMSTLERLEFTYTTTKGSNNSTSTSLEVHVTDVNPYQDIPITDLVNLKMNFNQMQEHFDLMMSTQSNTDNTINRTHLNNAYQLISKVQQQQINMLENIVQNTNQPRNISVHSTSTGADPSKLYNVIISIEDSYTKLRVLLDSVMSIVEILLLYMSPLCLIIRTDYMLRDTVGDVWDININEQQENNLGITTYGAKEHILDHVKDTEGFRVCGYKVEFFKTLILASFGPFFAIALRATWKHFGLY